MESIKWNGDILELLDQTKLPLEIEYRKYNNYTTVAEAIKNMVVRGAPAIGVAAAFGMVLASRQFSNLSKEHFFNKLHEAGELLKLTRPTAVNLFWAVDRMTKIAKVSEHEAIPAILNILEAEALNIYKEDIELNKSIGRYGLEIVPDSVNILTHCNAGALATAGYGTALGVIRAAKEKGKLKQVYACETRPLLQGARLTAWELSQSNIPVTLVTDSMAGYLMVQKKIDMVIVGADRIATNGDTANKIGTYSLAILAKYHEIPFYIAAPYSTIDFEISSGEQIIVEERSCNEIRHVGGVKILPDDITVYNPAFDVTPAELITGIITNKGIIVPPFNVGISNLFRN